MNIDDPKLTAFALDELDEPERSTIAREVTQSPEAQRVVDETRELARGLKNEFAPELNKKAKQVRNLSDIRDDPWFWVRARPLALAAGLAIFATLGAIVIATYSWRRSSTTSESVEYSVEGEERPHIEALPASPEPKNITNPLRGDAINRIEHVVIGEISVDRGFENGELRLIEIINDAYRIQGLKERLRVPVVSQKSFRGLVGRAYGLMFLDRGGHVVAAASFYSVPEQGFVLQPLKDAYERDGRYFIGGGAILPGDWKDNVNYPAYAIPFPDWHDCIGYAPGV